MIILLIVAILFLTDIIEGPSFMGWLLLSFSLVILIYYLYSLMSDRKRQRLEEYERNQDFLRKEFKRSQGAMLMEQERARRRIAEEKRIYEEETARRNF